MKIDITAKINIPKNIRKIDNDIFWKYAASSWHRIYSPFVPNRTGNLMEDVTILPKQIEHNAEYGMAMYFGNFKFSTSQSSAATRLWDKKAILAKKDEQLIRDLQKYINSGRLNLGQ